MTPGKIPYVLIVEDNRDVAAYFRQVLDLAGYRTRIVSNGNTAVELLHKNPPDIVLLDLLLPGLSGTEVLKIIHSEESLKHIRVVIVTGYSQIANSLPDSNDLVLQKPVSPEQLSDLVGREFQNDATLERHPFTGDPWDRVTGLYLYNPDFFSRRLESALESYKENPETLFGVIVVSIDHDRSSLTKPDSAQVEKAIQQTAMSIKVTTRPTDTIARFNGNLFYILVENLASEKYLSIVADRIQQELDRHPAEGLRCSLKARLCSDDTFNVDEILVSDRLADPPAEEDPR
jgi:PleD family two-component response regulator